MKNSLIGLVCLLLLAVGCKKEPLNHLSDEESRIYITHYDTTANFASFKTYAISDSVATIVNGQLDSKEKNATSDAYIAALDQYLQQRGYTKVARENQPDLAVTVNKVINTQTFVYNDYYDYYGNYWDPGYWGYWGYGYGYPYSYGVYQVTEGALSFDILDLKNAATKNRIMDLWTGLVRGEHIYQPTLSNEQVGVLFGQSPYLQTN